MRISLSGWASNGLRCPDVEIKLAGKSGEPAKVALVQMPNGTGKTTTLELIRATLTGQASTWPPTRIRDYRRPGDNRDKGEFRVALLLDRRPLTIELILDFENGTASYRTTTPGSGGVVGRWQPPPSVLKFLTPDFLHLFIFDGEFADKLLKQDAGRADEAISALCQLDLLDIVAQTTESQWKKRTSQGGGKTAAALTKLNGLRDALLRRRSDLEKARDVAQRKIDAGSVAAADLTKKIADRLGSVEATRVQHAEAILALQGANNAVSKASGEVMDLLRMPLAVHKSFSESLVELRDNLDHLKLPENTSAQFFADLVQEPDCICGRPMSDVARDEILKRAKGYLDMEESGTINALKHDITMFVAAPGDEPAYVLLERVLKELTSARRQQREADQTLRALAKKLIDEGDELLKEWQDTLGTLETELARCKQVLQEINAPSGEDTDEPIMSMKLVEKKLDEVGKDIAKLSETVDLRSKTDIIEAILKQAARLARDEIRAELVQESNKRLSVILANDPLRIDRIDKSLHLANQSGASVGQKLSVGYTFLMSALNRGNNDFPLIVDSPANSIDEGVRRNIGKLIPELCTQFVGFTINTERAGFVQALEKVCEDCLFLTVFRRTEGTKRLERTLPPVGVTKTDNAVLVNNRDYFMSFDLTDEKDI
ncbi:ATP-binding protein [Mesorhizobium sp. WSM3224]|uniref:ATP-binding protein n=1 Tax=Mesorhizobium sp. WSM3224 TaxID=1040986 RepID=UPI0012EC4A26|nr:ATP-binding protein [Mesorhizobium sp. WSM3224]